MKLTVPYDIASKPAKTQLVKSISGLIEGNRSVFEPYRPNEYDWDFWTLDSGNDWKIKFYENNTFEIWYRYDKDCEIARKLVNWLTFRLSAHIVEK